MFQKPDQERIIVGSRIGPLVFYAPENVTIPTKRFNVRCTVKDGMVEHGQDVFRTF
jgi:hypothetical protein